MGRAYTLGNQMSLHQTCIRRCPLSILVNNFVSLKKIHRLTALRRHQMKLEITKQLFPVDIVSRQLHLSTDIEDINDSQINQLVIRWAVKYTYIPPLTTGGSRDCSWMAVGRQGWVQVRWDMGASQATHLWENCDNAAKCWLVLQWLMSSLALACRHTER